jgi:hypothetical protein
VVVWDFLPGPWIGQWPSVVVRAGHAGVADRPRAEVHDDDAALAWKPLGEPAGAYRLAGSARRVQGLQMSGGRGLAGKDFVDEIRGHQELGCDAITETLEKLLACRRRMGWSFPWASSGRTDFSYDFHVTIDAAVAPVEYYYRNQAELEAAGINWREWSGEQPGMSAFALADNAVCHSCSAYSRGLDALWNMWQWLDRAPPGRNEGDMSWLHRHDQYEGSSARR